MKIVEFQSHSIKELDDQIALSFLKNLKTHKPKIVYSSRPFSVETEEWLVVSGETEPRPTRNFFGLPRRGGSV